MESNLNFRKVDYIMSKRKRYSKAFMELKGGKRVCVNELIENVNKFDKEFGLKLKHPDIWIQPEMFVESIYAQTDINIGALICILNGINPNDWFDKSEVYGINCKPINIDGEEFTEASLIDWKDEEKYNTDSLIFRCRFLTLVLFRMLGRTDNIIKREIKNVKHSKDEKAIMKTKSYVADVTRFVKIMIHPDGVYKNIILKMHEYISYSKKKCNQFELKDLVNGHIVSLRENTKSTLMSERFFDDDLLIYTIMKISYLLATNDVDLDNMPNFKEIEGATLHHDMIGLIAKLGTEIIKASKRKKTSPMFNSFRDAHPYIWSEFENEMDKDYSIELGMTAIAYTDFVCDNKDISKFIKEIKKRGI